MIDIALEIPSEVQSWFPLKASSRLRNWTAVNWEQYKLLEVTQHLVQGTGVFIVSGLLRKELVLVFCTFQEELLTKTTSFIVCKSIESQQPP